MICKKKDVALNKAVETAEKLRLENIYLEEALENLRKEQSAVVENYEQENHTLRNKLSVHEKLASQYESSLQDECDNWQSERLKLEGRLARQHGAELAALQQQLRDANGLLEREKLTSAQREDTIAIKTEQLAKLKKEVLSMQTSLHDTLQGEYAELVSENCNLKLEVQGALMREHELTQSVEQLQGEMESLKMKEENWKYEKERIQSELSSCYEMIEMQISTLLQTSSKTTDERLVKSLDVSLSSSRAENTKLLSELKALRELVDNLEEAKNSRLGDSGPVAKMMENELKTKNEELAKVREEMRLNKIYSTIEAKKVTTLQKEIFEQGRLLDAANSARYRLQLEFDKWKMNHEGGKKMDLDSFASEKLPCREDNPQSNREMNNNRFETRACSNEPSADSTENNGNDFSSKAESEDADKENEAPAGDAHEVKGQAGNFVSEGTSARHGRLPLAEKTIEHKITEDAKTEANVNSDCKEAGKPRKRPGFENTIDTADCKQQ